LLRRKNRRSLCREGIGNTLLLYVKLVMGEEGREHTGTGELLAWNVEMRGEG
jgi:hypothetical protein